jgi:hypothetical protein
MDRCLRIKRDNSHDASSYWLWLVEDLSLPVVRYLQSYLIVVVLTAIVLIFKSDIVRSMISKLQCDVDQNNGVIARSITGLYRWSHKDSKNTIGSWIHKKLNLDVLKYKLQLDRWFKIFRMDYLFAFVRYIFSTKFGVHLCSLILLIYGFAWLFSLFANVPYLTSTPLGVGITAFILYVVAIFGVLFMLSSIAYIGSKVNILVYLLLLAVLFYVLSLLPTIFQFQSVLILAIIILSFLLSRLLSQVNVSLQNISQFRHYWIATGVTVLGFFSPKSLSRPLMKSLANSDSFGVISGFQSEFVDVCLVMGLALIVASLVASYKQHAHKTKQSKREIRIEIATMAIVISFTLIILVCMFI